MYIHNKYKDFEKGFFDPTYDQADIPHPPSELSSSSAKSYAEVPSEYILFDYTYKTLIYLKIIFVASILLITAIAVLILLLFDPGNTFNNVLEWNYFIFLLIFYALSALLWRDKTSVHTPEGKDT